MIPKYFFHSCFLVLSNVNNPKKLNEFRPICLSNFTRTIISKLMNNWFSSILPPLISPKQSVFVKSRSINEKIMLALDIIHQIKKPNIGSKVIIKLDMEKAYDRVLWSYICLVLRKMGFSKVFIDMVLTIMETNWYWIIFNGKKHGFFNSTRGLKQADPNRLHNYPDYHVFFIEMRGFQQNNLSFADDIIFFTSGRWKTLKVVMATLKEYEETSGQLNREKSHFMLNSNTLNSTRDKIRRLTGFK